MSPDYLKNSESNMTLDEKHAGRPYIYELCLFRYLSVHTSHRTNGLENSTLILYGQWVEFASSFKEDVGDQDQF